MKYKPWPNRGRIIGKVLEMKERKEVNFLEKCFLVDTRSEERSNLTLFSEGFNFPRLGGSRLEKETNSDPRGN
jgi:hypothetical protein